MRTRDDQDRDAVEAMLSGGRFHMSEALRRSLVNRLEVEKQKAQPKAGIWWGIRPATAIIAVLAALLILAATVVALSPKEKAASLIDGVNAVYQAGLVQVVDQTQMAGDIAISLDWVYADANQILVAYSGQDLSSNSTDAGRDERIEIELASATLADGTALEGSMIAGYTQPGTEANVATFRTPNQASGLDAVEMKLVFRASYTQYQERTATAPDQNSSNGQAASPLSIMQNVTGEVTFSVTTPVYPAEVIEISQTVEKNGIAIRLEQVRIAPSLTIATVCLQAPYRDPYRYWTSIVILQAGGQAYSGGGSEEYLAGEPVTCREVQIQGSVPQQEESYTLRVDELVGFKFGAGDYPTPEDHPEQQMRIRGPWVFTIR